MQIDKNTVEVNRRGESRTADDLFELLITEPLNRLSKIPEASRLCLVIDALDEAGQGGHNPLAELLAKHAGRLPDWLGVLVTSRPEPYLEQTLKPLSSIAIDAQSEQNQQDLACWIDARLPPSLLGEARQSFIDAVISKSGGTFLYLSLLERGNTLDLTKPENLPDQLDGFFKQTFNRYFSDIKQYGEIVEPFLRLLVGAPGPLTGKMGQEILGWNHRDFVVNVVEPMGSLLGQREDGFVLFHAALRDWLKNSHRSGSHCVDANGSRLIGNFLWSQLKRVHAKKSESENFAYCREILQWLPRLCLVEDIEDLEFTVVDVETTGVSPTHDRITRIDAVRIVRGKILSSEIFSQLVNPGIDIPDEIVKLTGISNEMVKESPTIGEALSRLDRFLGASVLVSHNAIFTIRFLEEASKATKSRNITLPWLCTLKLSRRLFPKGRNSLRGLYEAFHWEWSEVTNYALAEARLFLELKTRLGPYDSLRI